MKMLVNSEAMTISGGVNPPYDMATCFFLIGEERTKCFDAATSDMRQRIESVPVSEWSCKITDLATGIETKINCQTHEPIL